jgi:hypothetical protein
MLNVPCLKFSTDGDCDDRDDFSDFDDTDLLDATPAEWNDVMEASRRPWARNTSSESQQS